MSEFQRRIKRMAGSLRRMLPEVPNALSSERVWYEDIAARRTLGHNSRVEAWFLAQFFLETYVDWRDFVGRWTRYFGQSDSRTARSSERLNRHCRTRFVNGLPFAPALRHCLQQMWTETLHGIREASKGMPVDLGDSLEGPQNENGSQVAADSLMHELIRCDRHYRVAVLAESQAGIGSFGLIEIAQAMNTAVEDWLGKATEETREEVRFYVRHYRHSMLRLSWLGADDEEAAAGYVTTLNKVLKERRSPMSWLHTLIDELAHDEAMSDVDLQLANRVLSRIADAVEELGYECFAEDLSSRDFLGSDDSPVGSDRVNVIPSRHKGACHSIVVAVAQGASRTTGTGFPRIMRRLKTHLIECASTTRVAIVLCDQWDSRSFADEHFDELRAHYRKGVRFVFLVAGTPSRRMARVPVDFGA